MPSSFPRRLVVEVLVTELTQPAQHGSKITYEPPMSAKNKVREVSMSVGDVSAPDPKRDAVEKADAAETAEGMFTASVDGFSPGILGHPKLYLDPEKSYRIVPKKDQERLLRFAIEEPLPEHRPRKP
jgi:hypothetical protein